MTQSKELIGARWGLGATPIVAALLIGCVSSPTDAPAEDAAAARGRSYAEANCSRRHSVERGGELSPLAPAPSFQSLAARPGMNRMALAGLLRTPHRSMPNLIVPADRIDDLAAYLESLEPADI
jgi:mono/diheme cytochrome c family protein